MQRKLLTWLLLPVTLGACSTTGAVDAGDVTGADGVEAGADGAESDAAVDVPADVSPLGPATWSGIYADYFGPQGVATCGGGGCHTLPTDAGVIVTNFICTDKEGCYQSLVGASKLVLPADYATPAKSKLMRNLRQAGNAGKMPSKSTFVFSPADAARIEAWIANGAKDD